MTVLMFWRHYCFLGFALLLACWAGRRDVAMNTHLDLSITKVHQAMRYTVISMMEEAEVAFLQAEAQHEVEQAENFEVRAQMDGAKAAAEKNKALQDELLAEQFANLASIDAQQANALLAAANDQEKVRLAILANMTQDQEQEDKLQSDLEAEKIHAGLCGWSIMKLICIGIGDAAKLQHDIDDEDAKIHQEMRQAGVLSDQQVMERQVSAMLLQNSTEFNRTAAEMRKAADYLLRQSREDSVKAEDENYTAFILLYRASRAEQLAAQTERWESKNSWVVQRLLLEAQNDHVVAYRNALAAIAAAVLVLVSFIPDLLPRLSKLWLVIWTWWNAYSPCGQQSQSNFVGAWVVDAPFVHFWGSMSFLLQHVVIFFVTVGLVGSPWLVHLLEYNTEQRAVILVWFAFSAALIQSVVLHVLPQAMTMETPMDPYDWRRLGQHFWKPMVTLTCLFLMEVMFAWLLFGADRIFNESGVQTLSSALYRAVFVVSLGFHLLLFEPTLSSTALHRMPHNPQSADDDDDESVSLNFDSTDETPPLAAQPPSSYLQEITPLRRGAENYSTAADDGTGERIYSPPHHSTVSGHAVSEGPSDKDGLPSSIAPRSADSRRFSNYTSLETTVLSTRSDSHPHATSFTVAWWDDTIQRLFLLFEILVVSCMIAIVWNCFPFLWSYPRSFRQSISIGIVVLMTMVAAVAVMMVDYKIKQVECTARERRCHFDPKNQEHECIAV